MLNLTTQERAVIIFLVVTLLLGSVVRIITNRRLENGISSDRFLREAAAFDSVSTAINAASMEAVLMESQSGEYGEENSSNNAALSNARININLASQQELEQLPGIGPSLAKRIISYRDSLGPFEGTKEITAVKGIGDKLFARIEGVISTE